MSCSQVSDGSFLQHLLLSTIHTRWNSPQRTLLMITWKNFSRWVCGEDKENSCGQPWVGNLPYVEWVLSTLACKVSLQNCIFQLARQVISGRFLSRFLQKYPLSRWLNDWRIFNWLLFSQLGLVVFLPAIMPESCRFCMFCLWFKPLTIAFLVRRSLS